MKKLRAIKVLENLLLKTTIKASNGQDSVLVRVNQKDYDAISLAVKIMRGKTWQK